MICWVMMWLFQMMIRWMDEQIVEHMNQLEEQMNHGEEQTVEQVVVRRQ